MTITATAETTATRFIQAYPYLSSVAAPADGSDRLSGLPQDDIAAGPAFSDVPPRHSDYLVEYSAPNDRHAANKAP